MLILVILIHSHYMFHLRNNKYTNCIVISSSRNQYVYLRSTDDLT